MYSYKVAKPCTSLDQYQEGSHREIPCVVWTLWVPYPLSDIKPFIEIISSCGSRFAMENYNRWKIPIDVQVPLFSWNKQIHRKSIIAGSSSADIHIWSQHFPVPEPEKASGKKDGKPLTELLGSWNHRKNPQVLDLLTSCIKDDSVAASELREVCGWQTVGWMDSKTQGTKICHQTGKGKSSSNIPWVGICYFPWR